jgi:cullin 3
MISRMKIELGNSFTMKLEAMFKDMTISEELTSNFRKRMAGLGGDEKSRVDLTVNVLTSMTWPLEAFRSSSEDDPENKAQIIWPSSLERVRRSFEQFYAEKHSGRKLTWQTSMGDVDVRARFPKSNRIHDVNCSTYAALVLLLFNDLAPGTKLSLEQIQAQTNIPLNALKRNLQSLAVAPKTRFLVKEPMSREVNPGDQFSFNDDYKPQTVRIKVGVVSPGNKVEGDRERKETEKKNNDTRHFQIEAALVRIMKQRKELSHAQLLGETINVLSSQFKPDVNMIKKCIESLIEREYLERMEDTPVPSYKYLA